MPGGDVEDICEGRGGVGGQGLCPRIPARGLAVVAQQLLDQRRVQGVAPLLSQLLALPLHLNNSFPLELRFIFLFYFRFTYDKHIFLWVRQSTMSTRLTWLILFLVSGIKLNKYKYYV